MDIEKSSEDLREHVENLQKAAFWWEKEQSV